MRVFLAWRGEFCFEDFTLALTVAQGPSNWEFNRGVETIIHAGRPIYDTDPHVS